MTQQPKTREQAFLDEGVDYTTEEFKSEAGVYLTETLTDGGDARDLAIVSEFVPDLPEPDEGEGTQVDLKGSLFASPGVVDPASVPEDYEYQENEDEGFMPFTVVEADNKA